MKYPLLVLDLDGTLTNSQKQISPANLSALMEAQQKGVKVVLASGRPTYGIEPIAREIGLSEYGGYILSYNGAQIINWATGEVHYEKLLSPEVYPYLRQCARDAGLTLLSYKDRYVVTEDPENPYVIHEAKLNRMPIMAVPDILATIDFPVAKFLIVGDPNALAQLEPKMRTALGAHINVFRSEPFFLELVPLGIDKALSLAVLLEHLNLDASQMMAMGDGYNDLSMIRMAGMGIAMENAQDAVKQHARYVTLTNDADGVAHAIRQFCM